MIFCGDTILPSVLEPGFLSCINEDHPFLHTQKTVNLESSIALSAASKTTAGIALRSDKSVIELLKRLNVSCVTTANNHFFDYDIDLEEQLNFLKKANITPIGCGPNLQIAATPYICHLQRLLIVAFGWSVIGCKYATHNEKGVNPYRYHWVLKLVKQMRSEYPAYQIVTVFHWNYEFEIYPQPADRQFAKALIDSGVDAVIGHHAHVIQGFEFHNGKPIFYGLGNFYFPNGNYDGFDMQFPPCASKGLCVRIAGSECYAYITEILADGKLGLYQEGRPSDLDILTQVSDFAGLTDLAYEQFFRNKRMKKRGLPVYVSYKHSFRNNLRDQFVRLRQIPLDLRARVKGTR